METAALDGHAILTDEAWLDARRALVACDKSLTGECDALRVARRALPWCRIRRNDSH